MMETFDQVHAFWFGTQRNDAEVARQQSKLWWAKNPETDDAIRARFETLVQSAGRGDLAAWEDHPLPLLALILLTDQFTRNIYRGSSAAFQFDARAQDWSLRGLDRGIDRRLRPIERVFLYLPLEHAESIELQERSVQLFTRLFQEVPADQADLFRGYLTFALRHRRVIERFGRFPHRNAILGRESTPEELAFLAQPGSSF